MLILRLLSHGWKQSLRSASRGQNIAGNLLVFAMILLIALNMLGLGLFLHVILKQLQPETDPLLVFNGWVIYYLGIDLLLRQILQRIPGQAIVPYMTLRVRKSLLVHLLVMRSFVSFFNLLPWVLIIPFAVNAVVPAVGTASALAWMAVLGLLLAANSLLNLLLKKLARGTLPVGMALAGVIAAFFGLDYVHVITATELSRDALGAVLALPALSAAAVLVPALLYGATFALLRGKIYLEDLYPATAPRFGASSRYRFLEEAGIRGRFVALELKLFMRNRRSRASLIMGVAVLPLGVLFYEMMLGTEHDPYPIASAEVIEAARQLEPGVAPPGFRRVTFRVDTGIVPPFAQVYVTGNHPALSSWKPAANPLLRNPDSTWSRSFLFEQGTELRYCFTLGDWQSEEKLGEGSDSPVHELSVRSDTTIVRTAIVWKTPEMPIVVMINFIYWGLLMTGILMFAYGQFFLSWDSTFFDALLSWRIPFRLLLWTKVSVLFAAGLLSYVLTIPYVFLDPRILLYNTVSFVYNLGVNSYVLLYLASRVRKRFELNESILSQQGKGAAQFIAIVPMWIAPIVIFAVLDGLGVPYALYLYFGGLGLLGLVFHRPLLNWTFALLEKNRYAIASGFREGGTI